MCKIKSTQSTKTRQLRNKRKDKPETKRTNAWTPRTPEQNRSVIGCPGQVSILYPFCSHGQTRCQIMITPVHTRSRIRCSGRLIVELPVTGPQLVEIQCFQLDQPMHDGDHDNFKFDWAYPCCSILQQLCLQKTLKLGTGTSIESTATHITITPNDNLKWKNHHKSSKTYVSGMKKLRDFLFLARVNHRSYSREFLVKTRFVFWHKLCSLWIHSVLKQMLNLNKKYNWIVTDSKDLI